MDPNLNYRHVQVRSADLHRQAELHRLAAQARDARHKTAGDGRSRLRLGALTGPIRATFVRFGTAARAGAALGSKTDRV
jgi:hypothetical protein